MEFTELIGIVGQEPVFETGLLLAGDANPSDIRRQLSRWKTSGKIYQLRRGLYCLAPPFQKVKPHPFLVANRMLPASYISLHSALAYYGMIPESMCPLRPASQPDDLQIGNFPGNLSLSPHSNRLFLEWLSPGGFRQASPRLYRISRKSLARPGLSPAGRRCARLHCRAQIKQPGASKLETSRAAGGEDR